MHPRTAFLSLLRATFSPETLLLLLATEERCLRLIPIMGTGAFFWRVSYATATPHDEYVTSRRPEEEYYG